MIVKMETCDRKIMLAYVITWLDRSINLKFVDAPLIFLTYELSMYVKYYLTAKGLPPDTGP